MLRATFCTIARTSRIAPESPASRSSDGEGDAVGSYRFRLLDLAQASAFTPGETVEGTLGEIGVTVDLPWAPGGAPLTAPAHQHTAPRARSQQACCGSSLMCGNNRHDNRIKKNLHFRR
jgi:hypothetical protein